MKILVFGANGKVGQRVVDLAVEHGHTVIAFVHNNHTLSPSKNLIIFQGDVYDNLSVDKAMTGCDAVISVLGSWGTPRKDVLTAGMKNIIPAMQKHKISKIISLTGVDSKAKGDSASIIHSLSRFMFSVFFRKILQDGDRHIQLLSKSNLDWYVLRSPVMTQIGDPKQFKITMKRPMPWSTIHRQSVVIGLIELLESNVQSDRSPYIKRA